MEWNYFKLHELFQKQYNKKLFNEIYFILFFIANIFNFFQLGENGME